MNARLPQGQTSAASPNSSDTLNGWKPSLESALIPLSLILLTLPLLAFRFFPNQDGPAHVNSANTLQHLRDPSSFLHKYFNDSGNSVGNWATAFVFEHIPGFIPLERYEALMIALYLFLFAAAVWFTTRSLLKVEASAGLAYMPLAYTHMLHMGSFNLMLAVPPFIVLLGACHRYIVHPTLRIAIGISLLSMLIFVIHVQASLVALVCLGLYASWALLFRSDCASGVRPLLRSKFLKSATLAAAGLPLFVACLSFTLLNKAGGLPSHFEHPGLLMRLGHLAFLSGVATYSVFGMGVALLTACGLASVVVVGLRQMLKTRTQNADCLLLCAVVVLAIFFALPNGYTDTYNVEERLMPFLLALIVSWFVIRIFPIIAKHVTLGVIFGILMLQAADRAIAFRTTDAILADYATITRAVPDKAVLVMINLEQVGHPKLDRSIFRPFEPVLRFDPSRSFIGTALSNREVAFLSNYQAETVRPYFALKYNPWLAAILTGREPASPEATELESGTLTKLFQQFKSSNADVTHAIIWRADLEDSSDPHVAAAASAIRRNCDRVATSPSGRVELCKIKTP